MGILISVLKFAGLAFLLNVLLRQTYNFVFFLGGRPWTWVGIVTLLGFGIVAMWGILGWSHSIVVWSCVAALVVNIPPAARAATEGDKVAPSASDVYRDMGISGGKLKYRLGLVGFTVAAIVAYALFFGQTCSGDGDCLPLFQVLFGNAER